MSVCLFALSLSNRPVAPPTFPQGGVVAVPTGQVRGEAVDAVAALGVRCSGALHRETIQDSTTFISYKHIQNVQDRDSDNA